MKCPRGSRTKGACKAIAIAIGEQQRSIGRETRDMYAILRPGRYARVTLPLITSLELTGSGGFEDATHTLDP
jgi:hypothetical protein